MTKKILGAVSIGTRTYVAGQEDELHKAMQAEKVDAAALAETGAISGSWGAKASDEDEDSDEGKELPTVDELDAHLAGMDSLDEVKAMKRRDKRVTAKDKYDARIAELKGE